MTSRPQLRRQEQNVPLRTDEPKMWTFDIPTPAGVIPARVRMINSSNIEWIGWPVMAADLMFVQFKGGSRYVYSGVTRQRAVAAAYAASSGEYLERKIKPHYKVLKLR
jgi:hypothetical protein